MDIETRRKIKEDLEYIGSSDKNSAVSHLIFSVFQNLIRGMQTPEILEVLSIFKKRSREIYEDDSIESIVSHVPAAVTPSMYLGSQQDFMF
jgi:hypothetical protein